MKKQNIIYTLLIGNMSISNNVLAQQIDFSDLSSWTQNGNITSTLSTVNLNLGGTPFSLTPATNYNIVQVEPNNPSFTATSAETALGLSTGTITGQVGSDSTNYGILTKSLSLQSGTYSFAWSYASQDYLPFTDGAFFSLSGAGQSQFNVLARNGDTSITPPQTGFPAGTIVLQSFGSTAWNQYTFNIVTSGNYQIGFGGFNALDTGMNPILSLSSIIGTYTGTPVATNTPNTPNPPSPPQLSDISSATSTLADITNQILNPIFSGGTLVLLNNDNSSKDFTINANGGALTSPTAGLALLSGVFSGQGDLTVNGFGTLVLSGNNSYSGNTTINSGTLNLLGINTTTGTTQVNAGATLAINSGSALGSGLLDLVGSQTTPARLSVANTTTINNLIKVSYDPVFDIAQNTTTTITSAITDGVASGDVVVQGGGTLALTAANTYTGPTTVNAGSTLALSGNGSIAHSSAVNNNGTLNIANAASTVNVGGNYNQSATGNLVMKNLTPASSQLFSITGSAALGGTLTLNATAGTYVPHRYTLLTATGGVSNQFTSLATNLSSFTRLGYALSYDANDVYLNFTPNVSDTQAALQANAAALQGIYSIQTGTINNSLTYDCSYFDSKGLCLSTGGRYSNASNSHANTTSAMVIGGYRIDEHFRIGGYVDQNLYNTEAGSIASLRSNTPLLGVFGVWNENQDQTGLEARLAAGYNNSNMDINRVAVGTSELGYGKAGVDTLSGSGTLSYGFKVAPNWIASPYLGVRHTTVSTSGYTEQADLISPLTYAGLNQESLTALVGLRASGRLTDQVGLQGSAGLEQDMHNYTSHYTATGLDGLTSIDFSPNTQKSRLATSFGATYDLAKGHRLGLTGIYRQESFQNIDTKMAYLTYTMGF